MPAKGRHHFVPKLYLRAFQSNPNRIHLYNIDRDLTVHDASLRDQCYRHRFYGPTDDAEDSLALFEAQVAPVLQSIIATQALPPPESEEHFALLGFVTLQLLRTTAASRRVNQGADKMMKQAYSRDPRLKGIDLDTVNLGFDDPVLVALGNLTHMFEALLDLHVHLLISPKPVFVTSDNPAFKYNQYCQKIQHMGTTGALCRGLQIFVPLSPRIHLIFYDGTTYKVRLSDQTARISRVATSDVDKLNLMQLISAEGHIYFGSSSQEQDIRRLMPTASRHRSSHRVVVSEYSSDHDDHSSLLHEFEQMPDIGLQLTSLQIRKRALRIPLDERAQDYRKQISMPDLPGPPSHAGPKSFSRFMGRR